MLLGFLIAAMGLGIAFYQSGESRGWMFLGLMVALVGAAMIMTASAALGVRQELRGPRADDGDREAGEAGER